MVVFEAMSGIKINFNKTAMYPINISDSRCSELAHIFQCRVGKFPVPYLGIPLTYKKLSYTDWGGVLDKINKKLQNWKGAMLSIGGRVTLINSVISAMPLYMMSLYKIPEKVRKKIDSCRSNFLWQRGVDNKKRYALVNWKKICLKKENSGLGILDLKDMNIALLMKWWWRYTNPQFDSLWKQLVYTKYNRVSNRNKFSPFWKAISNLAHLGKISSSYVVGDGTNIYFWHSIWYNNYPLATMFPYLYETCSTKNCSLQDVVLSHGGILTFSRALHGLLSQDWNDIITIVHNTHLKNDDDHLNWRWESNGIYSSHSLYNFLNFRGVLVRNPNLWWEVKIPLKIQIFMWLVMNDKILSKHNMSRKGWQGNTTCCCCHDIETTVHMFLLCQFTRTVWCWMGACQDLFYKWNSIHDIINFAMTLPQGTRKAFLTCFSALCWSIWQMRNEIVFNAKQVKTTQNLLLLIHSHVQYWSGLADEETKRNITVWMPQDWDIIPIQMRTPDSPLAAIPGVGIWNGAHTGAVGWDASISRDHPRAGGWDANYAILA